MSTYTDEMRVIAEKLSDEGWDMRASVINHAADRMDRMEELIVNLMQEGDHKHEDGTDKS